MSTQASQTAVVLTYEGIQIRKDPVCFIVTELSTPDKNGKPRHRAGSYTYHTSLADAIAELSNRIFGRKLIARDTAGQDDLASLVTMLRAHRAEIRGMFRASDVPM